MFTTMWSNQNSHRLLVRLNLEIHRLKVIICIYPANLHYWIYTSTEMYTYVQTTEIYNVHSSTILISSKLETNNVHPTSRMDKFWYIHTVQFYRVNILQIYRTIWMTLIIQSWNEEDRNKRVYIVLFHLHKAQKQGKIN